MNPYIFWPTIAILALVYFVSVYKRTETPDPHEEGFEGEGNPKMNRED